MVLHVLRGLFILLVAAVGYAFLSLSWLSMAIALGLGVLFVCIDILSPRKKLAVFSGTLLGLVVGVAIAYALHFAVVLIVAQLADLGLAPRLEGDRTRVIQFVTMLIGLVSCYLAISFTLQTKDDFRFIIPYVEFSKKTKGDRPLLLDTSVLIDGRIGEMLGTGFITSQLVVPQFVLQELQAVADSADKLKRNRGRRGLEVLGKLRNSGRADVLIYEGPGTEDRPDSAVDLRLLELAKELGGRVITTDYNLNRVAELRGVEVMNINDLGQALRPVALPGEKMKVRLVKAGEAQGQGVGYLDDGTMVVVEHGRSHLDEDVELVVTSALQTSAGRMVFGRLSDGAAGGAKPSPSRGESGKPSAATRS